MSFKKLKFVRVLFLIAPPLIFSTAATRPVQDQLYIKLTPPFSGGFLPASTTANFNIQMTDIINNLNELDLNNINPLVRYDTILENKMAVFNSSNTTLQATTLLCANQNQQQNLIYNSPVLIGKNLNFDDTSNVINSFNCNQITIPIDVVSKTFNFKNTFIYVSANPTYESYILVFIALLAIWLGILILIKESLSFIKNGFLNYFWK